MFKPFRCIPTLGRGVEFQAIVRLFLPQLFIVYHCDPFMQNKLPVTSLSPTECEPAGRRFESEYLASKSKIKTSIIIQIRKPISRQYLKWWRHQAKYLVSYLHLLSKHMTWEKSLYTGTVTEANCSQSWWLLFFSTVWAQKVENETKTLVLRWSFGVSAEEYHYDKLIKFSIY